MYFTYILFSYSAWVEKKILNSNQVDLFSKYVYLRLGTLSEHKFPLKLLDRSRMPR